MSVLEGSKKKFVWGFKLLYMWGKNIGNIGEEYAAAYLMSSGFEICARNFHARYGELDIVCRKDEELIFVEVKTRMMGDFDFAETSIPFKKLKHLKLAAEIYLQKNGGGELQRFDLIFIQLKKGGMVQSLQHLMRISYEFAA